MSGANCTRIGERVTPSDSLARRCREAELAEQDDGLTAMDAWSVSSAPRFAAAPLDPGPHRECRRVDLP